MAEWIRVLTAKQNVGGSIPLRNETDRMILLNDRESHRSVVGADSGSALRSQLAGLIVEGQKHAKWRGGTSRDGQFHRSLDALNQEITVSFKFRLQYPLTLNLVSVGNGS